MAREKKETTADFLSHKVKDYAEYREFMKPHNTGRNLKGVKFHPASLSQNNVLIAL